VAKSRFKGTMLGMAARSLNQNSEVHQYGRSSSR